MKIALYDKSEEKVLGFWDTPNGVVAVRHNLPNGTQISPIVNGWEDDDYIVLEVVPFAVPEGQTTVGSATYQRDGNTLIESFGTEKYIQSEYRRMVRKSVVQTRLIEMGKMEAAYTALTSNPIYFARWFAPDRTYVYFDDPDALTLLSSIGCTPTQIVEIMADE